MATSSESSDLGAAAERDHENDDLGFDSEHEERYPPRRKVSPHSAVSLVCVVTPMLTHM